MFYIHLVLCIRNVRRTSGVHVARFGGCAPNYIVGLHFYNDRLFTLLKYTQNA